MKSLITIAIVLLFAFAANSQTTVFSDNFESGSTNWTLTGSWGLSTAASHSSSHSLTESPTGNYANNLNMISATMSNGVNLTSALSANLSFWAKYSIEGGFDYMYVDVSANGGSTWINVDSYDGVLSNWTQFNYSLGGYVGNSNVKVRFRFYSDGAVNFDGMYIDDMVITSDTVDNAAPLVIHNPQDFYQGTLGPNSLNADIIDVSGISTALLYYQPDGGSYDSLYASSIVGNTYTFTVPHFSAGTMVNYFIHAVDSSSSFNEINTDTFTYIAGNYISYDNAQVDFVDSIGGGSGAAVRVTLPAGNQQIASLLIRNYTDVNRPNDSMLVHVWTAVGGLPGVDIIPPIKVYPAATLTNTSAMTVVDLRADSVLLDSLSGDVFVGYTVPSGVAWAAITEPGAGGRSFVLGSTGWTAATGSSGAIDFHFRTITQPGYNPPPPPPVASFTFDTTYSPNVAFISTTSGVVDTYYWDFGDGASSSYQNTNHTYANNGTYQVCLKVTNLGGQDSICHSVSVNSIIPPIANFSFDISADPTVQFTDLSVNGPSQWLWDFDDNGATSSTKNTIHTYPAVGGTYHVCLTATNIYGSSAPNCQDVVLSVGASIDNAFANENIKIYPNPMGEKTNIDLGNINSDNISLKVYDIQSKLINVNYIVNKSNIEILRSGLTTGQYFVVVYINDKASYKAKLIVR
jgi:PKD repeat protein